MFEGERLQGCDCQLPGSALPVLSSQMPRTQWVLNWPGQVTIAGCQTYWTMDVEKALEASNISNQLFPQLTQQVGVRGSSSAPRTSQSLQELSPALSLKEALGWIQTAGQTPQK